MIGLYGGTCNNMYVFAKGLVDEGLTVTFIQDRKDNFPHSQPVWEDVECFFQNGFEYQSINWESFEKQYNWIKPSWYFIPSFIENGGKKMLKQSQSSFLIRYLACRFMRCKPDSLSVLNKMMECRFLIVSGIEPAILAMLSGKPYMLAPHGSDIRVAIGAEKKGAGIRRLIVEWLLVQSFKKAVCIGCQSPDASAEVPDEEYKRLTNLIVERIPSPYMTRSRLSKVERTRKLRELFYELNTELIEVEFYFFTPSRIHFHWKGHDRLLEAINENKHDLKGHFIFLGWGNDSKKAIQYIEAHALQKYITILPIFCSKKLLYRFFESVDLIVDAFNGSGGGYGTSLLEAMSVGCPIITWISNAFDRPGWEAPPVLRARSKDEISTAILRVSNREIDLDEWSNETMSWFKRVHDTKAAINVFKKRFGDLLF